MPITRKMDRITTNPITALIHEAGLTIADLARILEASHGGCRKYIDGERRISATHVRCLVAELGDTGQEIADALEARYWSLRPDKVERLVLFDDGAATPIEECDYFIRDDGRVVYVEPDDPNDTATYTIEEWKARFGEPGMASDRHGRMLGFFSTDPDYCE